MTAQRRGGVGERERVRGRGVPCEGVQEAEALLARDKRHPRHRPTQWVVVASIRSSSAAAAAAAVGTRQRGGAQGGGEAAVLGDLEQAAVQGGADHVAHAAVRPLAPAVSVVPRGVAWFYGSVRSTE